MSGFLQDLRFAFRRLRKRPGFTAVAILTLALGIGATTAIFSVVDGVLLRPAPYPAAEGLVVLWSRFDPGSGYDFPQFPASLPEYLDLARETRTLQDLAAVSDVTGATLRVDEGDPERVSSVAVTPEFFSVLQRSPHLGRAFVRDETAIGGPEVVILGYGLWNGRFGADPEIIGKRISVDGRPVRVVGVAPPGLDVPVPGLELIFPLRWDRAAAPPRTSHTLMLLGRLKPGVSMGAAEADLRALMRDWRERHPNHHVDHYLFLRPLLDERVADTRPALLVLFAASALVLLIACANVANLLLARGESRRPEFAVRAALGAGQRRVVRQVLTENLLLGLGGGALGVALAALTVPALLALNPEALSPVAEVGIDARVLGFSVFVSVTSALVFGVLPAIRSSGIDPIEGLSIGTTRMAGIGRHRFGRGLVVAEVAIALLLVIGAGLLMRTFISLQQVDPGFRPEGVLTARVFPREGSPPATLAFWEQLLERVRAMPGVEAAGVSSAAPFAGGYASNGFNIQADPRSEPPFPIGQFSAISPGWFEAMGIRFLGGRPFRESDDLSAPPVAIVNRALVERYFPGEDGLGQRIRSLGLSLEGSPWMTIVGVVESIRTTDLEGEPPPMWYVPMAQLEWSYPFQFFGRDMVLFVRTDRDPSGFAGPLREAVREVDTGAPVTDIQTMETIVSQAMAQPRFAAVLMALFGLVALGLGTTGIYSVLAYQVARRRREIGIRMAIGAESVQVARLVLREGMTMAMVGIALGLALALGFTRFLSGILFGVEPIDTMTYLAVAALFALIALMATYVPARQAIRVQPAKTLQV